MALKTTPESVKQKIDESLKPDNKLSKEEMNTIDTMYDSVSTEEWKTEVRNYVKSKLSGDTETKLLKLLDTVEVIKWDFNMDVLASKNDSKFFGIILDKKLYREWYSSFIIWPIINKNKDMFPNGHDTLDVVYWKKITDEVWLKSAWWMLKDKVTWFFSGIAWKISEAWEDASSDDMDLSKMWDIVTKLSKLWEDDPKKSLLLIEK